MASTWLLLAFVSLMSARASPTIKLLQVTDVHLDNYYKLNANILPSGCHDTPGDSGYAERDCDLYTYLAEALLTSQLQVIKLQYNVSAVLWTGDNVRHDRDPKIPRTQEEIVHCNNQVASYLSQLQISVMPCIGNNDVGPPHNYEPPHAAILPLLAQAWHPVLDNKDEIQAVSNVGYFARFYKSWNLTIINVNTQLFFADNKALPAHDRCKDEGVAAVQLEFLTCTLNAAYSNILFIGHVPPSRWTKSCYKRYSSLATEFKHIISGHIYAHTHQDQIMYIDPKDTDSQVNSVSPSVLPTFNSALRVWELDPSNGEITDYHQLYIPLAQIEDGNFTWTKEYTYSEAYPNFGSPWKGKGFKDILESSKHKVQETYTKYRYVSSGITTAIRQCKANKEWC